VGSWWSPVELTMPVTIDEARLAGVLDDWDRTVIDEPAYEGAVLVDIGALVPEYPRAGQMIDRTLALPLIIGSLESGTRQTVELPLTELTPVISDADTGFGGPENAARTVRELEAAQDFDRKLLGDRAAREGGGT